MIVEIRYDDEMMMWYFCEQDPAPRNGNPTDKYAVQNPEKQDGREFVEVPKAAVLLYDRIINDLRAIDFFIGRARDAEEYERERINRG